MCCVGEVPVDGNRRKGDGLVAGSLSFEVEQSLLRGKEGVGHGYRH
jgi:hypothetical protein